MKASLCVASLFCVCLTACAGENRPAVQRAQNLIRSQGQVIAFFSLPTYRFTSMGYNDYRPLDDGFELNYTLIVQSKIQTNAIQVAFVFDSLGRFDFCKVLSHTTLWTPFGNAVGEEQLRAQRAFMTDHPLIRNSRDRLRLVENSGPKQLCEFYLQLEQDR